MQNRTKEDDERRMSMLNENHEGVYNFTAGKLM